jgi:D-cysteine desulfhydrase
LENFTHAPNMALGCHDTRLRLGLSRILTVKERHCFYVYVTFFELWEKFVDEYLVSVPRMGWVERATPVTCHPALATRLGARAFHAKRDDMTTPLEGSSKTRKLDYLLALPRFKDATEWASVGAIGSGSLVAISAAAEHMAKRFNAYMFWEEISEGVLENLAYTSARTEQLFFYPNRLALGLRHPWTSAGISMGKTAVIPAGATSPWSTLGIVRAGLELAEDVRRGEAPAPDIVVCPHGTGGMAAGLSVGLGLGGLSSTVFAVSAVERCLSPIARVQSLIRSVISILRDEGVALPKKFAPAPVRFEFGEVGPGYGVPTVGSRTAVQILREESIPAESVYSGKAMAGLSKLDLHNKNVLFWVTPRRDGAPTRMSDQLPASLARRVASHWR